MAAVAFGFEDSGIAAGGREAQAHKHEVKRSARYMLFIIPNPHKAGNEVSLKRSWFSTLALEELTRGERCAHGYCCATSEMP